MESSKNRPARTGLEGRDTRSARARAVDPSQLIAVTKALPHQTVSAGDLIRSMRDSDRY
jgi:hypothetical protein